MRGVEIRRPSLQDMAPGHDLSLLSEAWILASGTFGRRPGLS
jgi:hypothetical protein